VELNNELKYIIFSLIQCIIRSEIKEETL